MDIFENDPKIDELLGEFGWKGFSIYFYLCTKAYGSDGYFYRWGFDAAASTARKMGGGIKSPLVREVVSACFRIGLFDRALFEKFGILTSRGIQKRYYAAIQGRKCKTVIDEFWLLENEESKGLVRIPKNGQTPPENAQFPPNTDNSLYIKGKVNISSSQAPAEPSPRDKRKKFFDHESEPYKAARYLDRQITKRLPKKSATEEQIQNWAADIDKVNRIDGYDWDLIADVLEFCQKDPFWQNNILSGKKFREKFLQLMAKMGGTR